MTRRMLTLLSILVLGLLAPGVRGVPPSGDFEKCACGRENYRAGFNPAGYDPGEAPFHDSTHALLYPWAAAIVGKPLGRNITRIICGATLVNWREVLTTKACALLVDSLYQNDFKYFYDGEIILGVMNFEDPAMTDPSIIQRFKIESSNIFTESKPAQLPPPWHSDPTQTQPRVHDDDLAIIYLKDIDDNGIGNPRLTDAGIMEKYSKYFFPICLREPKPNEPLYDSSTALMTLGWGSIGNTGASESEVQYYEDIPRATPACMSDYSAEFIFPSADQIVCLGDGSRGRICSIDDGGPLQVEDKNLYWHLIGIAAITDYAPSGYFRYCYYIGKPSIFINVHSVKSRQNLFESTGTLSSLIKECKDKDP